MIKMNFNGYEIKTIDQLEKLYYSDKGAMLINKSDAPVLSTTTGVYQPIYGAQLWSQFNTEANAFGISAKTVWTNSGWRVLTARPTPSPAAKGGIVENGTLPDTIKPTFQEISAKPKTVAHTFDVSEVQEILATEAKDDGTGNMDVMRGILGNYHKEMINSMLLTDVDTLAGYDVESYDRVISSYDEVTNCGITAGDADIYGLDRDAAASWADANVDENANVDRILTDDLLNTMINDTLPTAGGSPSLALTGYDTLTEINSLYGTLKRYNQNDALASFQAKLSVNGVETAKGVDVGFKVTSVYGIPIFTAKDVKKDTLSRIYFIDQSNPEGFTVPRSALDIAKPTQYFEAGMKMGTPFSVNRFGNEGMFRTLLELKCKKFAAQGKIRDLKKVA